MRLHIGGEEPKAGWKILNVQNMPHVDFVGDIVDLTQFDDQSVIEIYASHVLEHVTHSRVSQTLKGIHRVLRPGGKFYVSVPDMDTLCHTFINPILPLDIKYHVMGMMFGGQVDAHDFHCFGWNQLIMWDQLRKAGFSVLERVASFGLFNDTSDFQPYGFPVSLNVIATK